MNEQPAEIIRRAAELMRERAEAATPGPWWSDESEDCWRLHGVAFRTTEQLYQDGRISGMIPGQVVNKQIAKAPKHGTPYAEYWPDEADDAHITSMHPGVALAVADWLDSRARDAGDAFVLADGTLNSSCCDDPPGIEHALKIARAYLAGEPQP